MDRIFCVFFLFLISGSFLAAQDNEPVYQTFKDRRLINVHSVETLPARKLDIRIAHRFGDLAGEQGGFQTFFGLENATDVMIGAEYGVTDRFTAGLFRTKGAGTTPEGDQGLRQLLNGVFKYRLLRQTTSGSIPVSVSAVGVVSLSTAKRIDGQPELIRSFPEFSHRMATNWELILARKFSEGFALQFIPAYTHRNLVTFEDENGLFSVGAAMRVQFTKVIGLIADITIPINERRATGQGYYLPFGFGLEWETGGHVFQLNLTNARAIMETDYIPYTTSSWGRGEFRLGFTISRLFNL